MSDAFASNFARFVGLLRRLGIRVSTGDTVTALNALLLVNPFDREQVRIALQSALIKNSDEQPVFEQAFDSFFTTMDARQQQLEEWFERKETIARMIEEAERDLTYQGEKLDLTDEEKLLYSQLSEERKQKIKKYLESSSLPEDRYSRFKPVLESQVRGSLRYWKQKDEGDRDIRNIISLLDENEGDEILAAVLNNFSKDNSELFYQDIKTIKEQDFPKVVNILKKLSRKLATRISMRYRLSRKAQKIDLRRSIKSNLQYGGIIFKLKYRQKRVQKPKILLICDVSGSMSRYAAFVIQFMYGLSAAVKDIESFIFAEELEYVTPVFAGFRSFEEAVAELTEKSRIWGKGTNLGASLGLLQQRFSRLLNYRTVVIILSDTRTLEIDRAEEELVGLKRNVKDILWLNTIPLHEWKNFNSVDVFKRHCKMYECYTLAHLERIVRRLFLD